MDRLPAPRPADPRTAPARRVSLRSHPDFRGWFDGYRDRQRAVPKTLSKPRADEERTAQGRRPREGETVLRVFVVREYLTTIEEHLSRLGVTAEDER